MDWSEEAKIDMALVMLVECRAEGRLQTYISTLHAVGDEVPECVGRACLGE